MNLQIAKTFDQATVEKILKGLFISIAGALLVGLGILVTQLSAWVQACLTTCHPLVINWDPIKAGVVGALITILPNAAYQWYRGIAPDMADQMKLGKTSAKKPE